MVGSQHVAGEAEPANTTANRQVLVGNGGCPMIQVSRLVVAEDQVLHDGNRVMSELPNETRQLRGDAVRTC